MGQVTGKRGRDFNLLAEALLLQAERWQRSRRGRGLTAAEGARLLDAYAALWAPDADAADDGDWERELAQLFGPDVARRVRAAAAAKRRVVDWSSPDYDDLSRLVLDRELRRVETVAKYLRRLRGVPQLPKAETEKAPAAPDRTGCPPFRRPHRQRPPAWVPDYVPTRDALLPV